VDVQQLTDTHVKKAEDLYAVKEQEILKI
jgi:ribosome recycling factor